MNSFKDIINTNPIRNTQQQKDSFINWVKEYTSDSFYKMQVSQNKDNKNIVFGNTNTAKVIFTAHYDTPKTSIIPNLILVNNKTLSFIYGFVPFIILAIISILISYFVCFSLIEEKYQLMCFEVLFLILYYGAFFLLFKFIINKNNYNDNTSGVCSIVELIKKLKTDKVAFILFDNEEKSKRGSNQFAKDNASIKQDSLIINFDCVGNGDQFIYIATEKLEQNPLFGNIKKAYILNDNCHLFSDKQARYNSDSRNFDVSLGVLTCKKNKNNLLYCDRIHTNKDTVVDENNINQIVDCSIKFVDSTK